MLRKALRDLTTRKLRTALVVLSIAVGVFGVSAAFNLSGGLGQNLNTKYNASNPPDISITTSGITPKVVEEVRKTSGVEAVEERIVSFAEWKPRGTELSLQVVGLRKFSEHEGIAQTTLKQGAFPEKGEVLFEATSLTHYNLGVGETVKISGASGETQFKISGSGENVHFAPAAFVGFGTVFLTWDDAAKVTGSDKANNLLIKVNNIDQVEDIAARLRTKLAENDAVVSSLTVRDPNNPPGKDVANQTRRALIPFGVVALLTGSFLVVNTISSVIAEQRAQIGAMKAVGATTAMVTRVYLGLALLYGVLGSLVGLVLGIVGSYGLLQLFSSLYGLEAGEFKIAPLALIAGIATGLAAPVLAALLPVWLGARLTIREAIMSYGLVSDFGRGFIGRLALALSFLPQTAVLASRNLSRNRTRTLLTVVGLAAAGAGILNVYNANVSLDSTLNAAVKTYKADIVVQLSEPNQMERVTAALREVSGIQSSEGWFSTNVQRGEFSSDTLVGVPFNTVAYDTSKLIAGRWFESGEQEVLVITEQMQRRRGYKLDERVELKIGKQTVNWRVVGVTRDLLSGDSTFYAPIEQARRAADAQPGLVHTVLIKLSDSSHSNVDSKLDDINRALRKNNMRGESRIVYQLEAQIRGGFSPTFLILYMAMVVLGIVGGLGLFGTITMNVLERRREIGVLRSVGASGPKVLFVFLAEGLLLGLIGWLVAVGAGLLAAPVLAGLLSSLLLPLTVKFSPESLVITLLAVMGITFIAALLPSLSAAWMRVAEILRYA